MDEYSKGTNIPRPRVLVVDDDARLCQLLKEIFTSWEMVVHILTDPCLVAETLRETFYNLVLLDVVMPIKSGFELLADLNDLYPETKVIVMTGYADKAKVIEALRLGAFDFLEKPIAMDLLAHSVRRALHVQDVERAHIQTLQELQRSQEALLAHQAELERLNHELMDTNKALAVVAAHIERTRMAAESRIIEQIRNFILPAIDSLRRDRHLQTYEPQLAMLIESIEELQRGVGADLQVSMALTYSEWRVASLVKQGLTSEAIAAQLHITPDTVKTHRRNIRRKLNLVGSKNRLRSHLQSVRTSYEPSTGTETLDRQGGPGPLAWHRQESTPHRAGLGMQSSRDRSNGAQRAESPSDG
jgi:DNA-binding NarL/FixJ family response regulator